MKSCTGGCASVVVLILTSIFGLIKIQHMAARKNPAIISNNTPLGSDERLSLPDEGMMVALALTNW